MIREAALRSMAGEGARYLVAGTLALTLDFTLYSSLIRLAGVDYLVAAPIGFLAGLTLIYFLSVRWVFTHRRVVNARTEFLIFTGIGIAGLALNQLVVYVGVEGLRLTYELAKILSAGVVFVFNFVSRKLLLFTKFDTALQPAPGDPRVLYLRGERFSHEKKWAEAAGFFEQAVAADGSVAAYQAGLGTARQALGDAARAVAAFESALALDPDCLEAHSGLAIELRRQRRIPEVYDHLRRWVQIRVARGDRRRTSPGRTPVTIPATTLCCVDTRDRDLAADALARCLERCRFERALFFTDVDVRIEGVETVRIGSIASVDDYSRFVMKELDRHIRTDFALLVQYDGFVLNPDCWSAEFQRYDYVGARWPFGDAMSVGNGGFSLRSKRLLRALQDPQFAPVDPEDMAICRAYRPVLEERYGIRFAPEEVADRFSFEAVPPDGQTFGFHGLEHLVEVFDMSDLEVAGYRPPRLEVVTR